MPELADILASGDIIKVAVDEAPVAINDLTNKAYADTKVDKTGGTITGDLIIDGGLGGPKFLKVSDGNNSSAMTAEYVELTDGVDSFKMKQTPTGIDMTLNDVTSMTLQALSPPQSQYQPTDVNDLTRKDYVDTVVVKVTEAEIAGILEVNDFTAVLTTVVNLANNISRNDIELVIAENGLVNPVSDVGFIIETPTKVFRVYFKGNQYSYIKLKQAN